MVRCEIWQNLEFQEIDKTLIYVRSGIGEDEMFDQEIINDFSMRNSVLTVLKRHEGVLFTYFALIDNLQLALQMSISVS